MKRFRFGLLSLMIVVAMTALAAWGYALRRRSAELASVLRDRSAELDSALKRLSAEFASKADKHDERIGRFYVDLLPRFSFQGDLLPVFRRLDQTPQDSERQLRYLEQFYGYELTENDMARRGLTESGQAERMLLLLWLRYEVHMYFKYRRAAASPWLPVGPDPPEPPLGPYPPEENQWWKNGQLQTRIATYLKILPHCVPE